MNNTAPESRRTARLGWILALAAAYALSGKAGLLLAVPPGYATAVWPPSGIAAAALLLGGLWLWPGVLLGSLSVNLWMSGDFSTPAELLRSLMISGGVAAGASLQAVLAASLVRMSVPHLNIFRLESDVIRLLLIAGPVACVVNATIGVSTLFIAGLLPAESFLFNWWTWWIGDSIGVLVFLPLILIWYQRPYSEWINRQITISAPTVLIFSAVVCLFFFTSTREEARIRAVLEQKVNDAGHSFAQSVSYADTTLRSLAGLIEASPDRSPPALRRFTEPLLDGDLVLADLQYVQPQGPAADEATATPRFQRRFLMPNEQGLYSQDAPEDYFAEPALAAGLGMAAARRKPITIAVAQAGKAHVGNATRTIRPLFGSTDGSSGDFRAADAPLLGFLVASIKYDELAWKAFEPLKGIDYTLSFEDFAGRRHPLSGRPAAGGGDRGIEIAYEVRQGGGRLWVIFRVAPSYFVENRSWQAWGLLAVGLMFTALLCTVMLVLIGREARVEAIVAEKTRQLRRERSQISNLMSTFPDPHFVTDERGCILEVNDAALMVLGGQRSELVGTPVERHFDGDIMALIREQLDTQLSSNFECSRSVALKSSDDRRIPVAIHVSTFRSEDTPLYAITARLTT